MPPDLWRYLLTQHDRYARRALGPGFQGLHLHRKGQGDDGQIGHNQWSKAWGDHLERAVADDQDAKKRADAARFSRVEDALLELERRDRKSALILRFYMEDEDIRQFSVRYLAGKLGVAEDIPRRSLPKAIRQVWKLLGEVWV